MKCEDVKLRIPDILTGEFSPKERPAIDTHLAACVACSEELRRVTETWTKLGVLPQKQPSSALRDRFYTMLEAYQEGSGARTVSSPARSPKNALVEFFRFRRPAFRFAAAAALLLAGVAGGLFLGRSGPLGGRVGRLQAQVDELRQTTALSLLRQSSSSERLLGVSYSEQIRTPGQPTLDALLHTLDEDPSINVRLAAADALYLFASEPKVRDGIIVSLGRQTSPLVQVALIDLLVEIREKRAVEALKVLIERKAIAPEVKERAEKGLKQITA
jgi:anti-sigma factor RsiW